MPVVLAKCRKVRWNPKNARQTTRDATPSIEGKMNRWRPHSSGRRWENP